MNEGSELGGRPMASPPGVNEQPSARQLLRLILEDWRTHRRELGSAGFQALLAYRIGRLDGGKLNQLRGSFADRLVRRAQRRSGVYLDPTANIGRRVFIPHQGGVVVHRGSVIGDDCWLRQRVVVGGGAGDGEPGAVLGRDVRLGAGAIVLRDVVIGDSARIGPNAVVLADVEAGAMVVPPRTNEVATSTNDPNQGHLGP